jgi:hypothetical protein
MRDKTFKDGGAVSWQVQDIAAVQKQLKEEMRGKRAKQIQSAIDQCKRYVQPAEGREKLVACIREKLSATIGTDASDNPGTTE